MRKSVGLTLENDAETALQRYMDMHDFLIQGEKKINKLNSTEKKLIKETAKYKKNYGLFVKTVELRAEKRIDQKTFDEDLKKNIKNVKKSLTKLSKMDSQTNDIYKIANSMFEKTISMIENCDKNCNRNDLLTVIDSTEFTSSVLKDVEKKFLKKKI